MKVICPYHRHCETEKSHHCHHIREHKEDNLEGCHAGRSCYMGRGPVNFKVKCIPVKNLENMIEKL